jgi:hypothetical protein
LKVRLIGTDGKSEDLEVKQGGLEVLPLPIGATGTLELRPAGRTDAGLGPGRSYRVEAVKGSALGVVIDARGRPLRLDIDGVRRRELLNKWQWTLGG